MVDCLRTQAERFGKSMRGAYVLEYRMNKAVTVRVGKLGEFKLNKGYYYYVGSAMNGLRGRLLRYINGPGKLHWHIDYMAVSRKPERIWAIESRENIEREIAGIMGEVASEAIIGFGCSDSPGTRSHLFYSRKKLELRGRFGKFGNVMLVTGEPGSKQVRVHGKDEKQ